MLRFSVRSETKAPGKGSAPVKVVRGMCTRLLELFPSLGNVQVLRSWAGVVDVTPDQACIVQRLSIPEGFIVAVTSGHGFGMAPSIGRAVADLALTGRTAMPIEHLTLDRFAHLPPNWRSMWGWTAGSVHTLLIP